MLPLSTPRLVLRRFIEADAVSFAAYRSDPEVARYQDWDAYPVADATTFIHRQRAQAPGTPSEWFQIAITVAATQALAGDCAFKIHAEDPRQATIGITLARSHQGQGYAAEALTCLLDELLLRRGLHRVVADTDPRNIPSWTLLERLGMRREGHLIQSVWFKGRWADEYLYAILREEWLSVRDAPHRLSHDG